LSKEAAYIAYVAARLFGRLLEKSYATFEQVTHQREKSSTYQDTIEEEDDNYDGISVEMRGHPELAAALAAFQVFFVLPIISGESVGVFNRRLYQPLVSFRSTSSLSNQRRSLQTNKEKTVGLQYIQLLQYSDSILSHICMCSLLPATVTATADVAAATGNSGERAVEKNDPDTEIRIDGGSRLNEELLAVAREYARIFRTATVENWEEQCQTSLGFARILCPLHSSMHDHQADEEQHRELKGKRINMTQPTQSSSSAQRQTNNDNDDNDYDDCTNDVGQEGILLAFLHVSLNTSTTFIE
jgi:hypothetical protein